MFINLVHDRLPHPVSIVVSTEGIFVKATDIGRIFDYKNLQQFANAHTRLRVKHVVPRKMELPPSTLKVKIFTVEKAVRLLEGCKRKAAEYLKSILERGEDAEVLPLGPLKVSTCYRRAMQVEIMSEFCANSKKFNKFLEEFHTETCHLFEKLAEEYRMQRIRMHLEHESLEEFNLKEPPRTVFVHFGHEVFKYRL